MIEVLSKQEILNLLTNNSRYQISKATGISEQTLSNYANGVTDVGRMSYNNAIKLTKYAKENEVETMKHTEQEVLDIIKDMELEPDMIDIWEDKDGDIVITGRGMNPNNLHEQTFQYVGYVDNGDVTFE
ncbi:helix-turn-helix domain-containing protein [Streptococcus sp.]